MEIKRRNNVKTKFAKWVSLDRTARLTSRNCPIDLEQIEGDKSKGRQTIETIDGPNACACVFIRADVCCVLGSLPVCTTSVDVGNKFATVQKQNENGLDVHSKTATE